MNLRHLLIPLALVPALLLSACTMPQARDTAMISAHLVALHGSYDEAAAVYAAYHHRVPDAQRGEVERAWRAIETLHAHLERVPPRALAHGGSETALLYRLARQAWGELRTATVTLIEAGEIDDAVIIARLAELDRRALALDEALHRHAGPGLPSESWALMRDLSPLAVHVMRSL